MAYIDPDKAKPAKTRDAAADMKVSSIKSESDNLIVTILATSNCDDKNASTKFNDSATRLTLQDSDDNVVADAVRIFRVYSTYTAQLSSKRKGMEAGRQDLELSRYSCAIHHDAQQEVKRTAYLVG